MEIANYRSYLLGNANTYSSTIRKRLIQTMVQKGIALSGESDSFLDGVIVLSKDDEKKHISQCIMQSNDAIRVVEAFEFSKAYKYSYVYGYRGFITTEIVRNLVSTGSLIPFNEDDEERYEPFFDDSHRVASLMEDNDKLSIKISFEYAFSDEENNRRYRKFAILVVIHKEEKLIEFRHDSVPSFNSANYYMNQVGRARVWIQELFAIEYDPVPMHIGVQYIVDHENEIAERDNVFITGKNLEFGNGSSAALRVGKSDSMVLPLLGEIKNFLRDYEEEFSLVPNLKNVFQNFIQEREQNAVLPCLYLLWRTREDVDEYEVKIDFDYSGSDGCRILFYAKNAMDGEGMSRVVKYIGSCQAAFTAEELDGRSHT